MILSRSSALLIAAIAGCIVLPPLRAHAQWWSSRAPADFEECADTAEKAATKEAKASALAECNAKFAGRRKPGGGYTYYDFMQNRHFDIAGPNPTPEEQKHIDEQYTAFLEQRAAQQLSRRRSPQSSSSCSRRPSRASRKSAGTAGSGPKPAAAGRDLQVARPNATIARRHSFSCDWPRLSEGIKDHQERLFGTPSKAKRELISRRVARLATTTFNP